MNGPDDTEGNFGRMGTFGDWGRAAEHRVNVRGSGSFLRLKVIVVALWYTLNIATFQRRGLLLKLSYFKTLTEPAKTIRKIKKSKTC